MYNTSLTAIPCECLRNLIGVLDAIHNQIVIYEEHFQIKEPGAITPGSFIWKCSFTSLTAQATEVVIACHYFAGRVSWGRERKARSLFLLEQEHYYSRIGLMR